MIFFSLYMWHLPFLFLFIEWGQPFLSSWPHPLAYAAYWLWVLVVTVPFCFLFFRLVERPGMKFGLRFN